MEILQIVVMNWKIILCIVLFSGSFVYCKSKTSTTTSPQQEQVTAAGQIEYDLARPAKSWTLPDELKEISGNAWVDANHLLVIEDLHPVLYLLRLENDKAVIEKKIPFAPIGDKKFDIEDVTLAGNTAYALWSHGVLYKIDNWQTNPQVKELSTDLDKANNTEGLCVDPVSHNLLIACKNEAGMGDEKKSDRAIYLFDIQKEKLQKDPFLVIEKKEFKTLIGEKIDFFPSAVAVHPSSHEVYLLSTKENKCMVKYSYDGKIQAFESINKDLMPQPEGICFGPDGTLFISTEGKHGAPAKIYRFDRAAK